MITTKDGHYMQLQEKLFDSQDFEYKKFQCSLMPTVTPECVIGVRTPILRALSKELKGSDTATDFFKMLPHKYYEENNLHAFLLDNIKCYDECIRLINDFLPYIDNWSTCDSLNPKVFAKNRDKLIHEIYRWISSNEVYTVRFAIGMLMKHYLEDSYETEYMEMVCSVNSSEYYINMMIAWYFATALSKQYDDALQVLKDHKLSPWVHNKAIQKAAESRRISSERKDFLRTLRV